MVAEKRPDQLLPYLTGGKNFPSVVFLYGPDDYTRNHLITKIIDLYLPNEKDRVFGLADYEAPDVDSSHLLGALKTVPFGLSKKIFILRRFELIATAVKKGEKAKDGGGKSLTPIEESLIRYFRHPSRDTLLLISSALEIKKNHSFTRAFPEDAILVSCMGLKGRDVFLFVKERLKELNKVATDSWIEQFVEICGPDTQKLSSEIEKVALFSGGRSQLQEEDLTVVSPGEFSRDAFALLDAIASGKSVTAVEILREIMGGGEHPLRVLSLILWHYRLVVKAQRLKELGNTGGVVQIHPSRFVVKKITRHAKMLSREKIVKAFDLLRETDLRLKGSRLPDSQIMESLVYALSGQCLRRA